MVAVADSPSTSTSHAAQSQIRAFLPAMEWLAGGEHSNGMICAST